MVHEMFEFLRFLTTKPSKDRFAKILTKEANRIGISGDLAYNKGIFSVRLGPSRPRLDAVYAEYCNATTDEARRRAIMDFLAPFNPSLPPLQWAIGTMLKVLPEHTLQKVKQATEAEITRMHFGLGMWIRNNLGLWSGSQLNTFLCEHGFNDADAMSRALLWVLRAHLRGEDCLVALEEARRC